MAASITGIFTILDRASRPMERMERQALKTMAAIEGVGKAADGSATTATTRKIEDQTRVLRNQERQAKQTASGLDKHTTSSRNAARETNNLTNRLGRLGAALNGVSKLFGALKITGLISGIALLVQWVGSLAGGLVALMPALGQAAAGMAALPQTVAAAVQGFGVFKAAMAGVGEALKAGMTLQQQHGQAVQDAAMQHVQAVHSVQQAEYGLMQSQRAVGDAQRALTQARRDAIRNLTDLRLAAIGADLGQKRAALSLREAQRQLAEAAINPQTTDLQMQDLQLGVQEARLGVRQSRVTRGRARADLRRGPQQTQLQVIQAQRNLADAIHSQSDATFQLTQAEQQLRIEQQRGTGVIAQYRQAMKNLSPPAQSFVRHLVAMRPALKGISAAAAGGLFPGLERSLNNVQRVFPLLRTISGRTGKVMGDATDQVTARLTTRSRQGDINTIAQGNDRILRRMILGMGNLGAALTDFMVAAQPFTNWLTHTIYMGTEWVARWARAGRESGHFAESLQRSQGRLSQFGRILHNLWDTLGNIFHAATPLGDRLWAGAEKATRGWKRLSDQTKDTSMMDWFNKLYEPLHETGQLIKDLAGAWARLSVNPALSETLRHLQKAVPDLERLFNSTSQLGPQAVDTIASLGRVFADLSFSPLTILLKAIEKLARAVDWLLRKVPGLSQVLSGLLMVGTLSKAVGLADALLTRWKGLFALWGGGVPGGGGGMGPMMYPGGGGGRGGGGGGFFPWFRRGGKAAGTAGKISQAEADAATLMAGGRVAGYGATAAKVGRFAKFGEFGGRFLAGAGRLAGPLAILGLGAGAIGGASKYGGLGGAAWGAADFADFGTGAFSNWVGHKPSRQQYDKNAQAVANTVIRQSQRMHGAGARLHALNMGIQGRGMAFGNEFRELDDNAKKQVSAILHQARATELARQRSMAQQAIYSLQQAMHTYGTHGMGAYGERTIRDSFRQQFREASGTGKQELAKGVASWIDTLRQGNKGQRRLAQELTADITSLYKGMGQNIQIVNGNILNGSATEWKNIGQAMTDPAEKAAEKVSKAFTGMQRQAVGSLMAMGFTRSQARGLVRGMEKGNLSAGDIGKGYMTPSALTSQQNRAKDHARGGRISGVGTRDTVPIAPGAMAAPGELIVNRHTEGRVNRVLAAFGTSLGREVASETKPHSAYATGGRLMPGISATAQAVLSRFPGLSITSTTGGHHAANSLHYLGEAVDLASGDYGLMNRAAAWIHAHMGRGLAEGIHNPNLSIKNGADVPPSFWGPTTWAEHLNHIHLGVIGSRGAVGGLGAAMMAGGGGNAVIPPIIRLPAGMAGAVGAGAMMANAAGLNAIIARAGGNLAGPNFTGGGTSGQNQALGRRMMLAMGFGAGEWPALKALWTGESNWNTTIANSSSGAYGIPQALPGSKMASAGADWRTNPATQIKWGLNYIRGRYGTPSQAYQTWLSRSPHWYSEGGRMPDWGGWHQKGGSFTVNRPTLFGAGEAGTETVHIQRGGGGGRRPIHVRIGHIDYRAEGDIADAVQKEIEKLADDLDLVGAEGD